MIHFHLISLFPDTIKPYIESSILGKAVDKKLLSVSYYNPMDYVEPSKHGTLPRRVDDKPYGGGPGMVIRAEPVIRAITHAVGRKKNVRFIHFAPRGTLFSTTMAQQICAESNATKSPQHIVIISGRYEGIDSRIIDMFPGLIVSIGEYVLTGGEIPAMALVDCVARQIPGVLGDGCSREETRIAPGKYYTRPETIVYKKQKYTVPEVLTNGNHADIDKWREKNH